MKWIRSLGKKALGLAMAPLLVLNILAPLTAYADDSGAQDSDAHVSDEVAVASDVSTAAVVESGTFSDEKTFWEVSDDGELRIWGTGKVDNYYFDSDGPNWNSDWAKTITSLVIEEGVTELGEGAFGELESLTGEVVFPSTITSIGRWLFWDCGAIPSPVTSIRFASPSSLETLSASTFTAQTALEKVELAEGLKRIEGGGSSSSPNGAFARCTGLTDIGSELPSTVEYIGPYAFANTGLSGEITVPHDCEVDSTAFPAGVTVIWKALEVLDSGTFADGETFWELTEDGALRIWGTGKVDDSYFSESNENWNDDWATEITSLVIEDGVVGIGEHAFDGCSSLASLDPFPSSLAYINAGAFQNTALTGVVMASADCSIAEGAFPDGVTVVRVSADAVDSGVFSDNKTYWELSEDGVLRVRGTGKVDDNYFDGYDHAEEVTSLDIADGVTEIGEAAFKPLYNIGGTVEIPASISSIGEQAFNGLGITGVVFAENSSLKTLECGVFASCKSLTSIALPKGLESIGDASSSSNGTFASCTALASVELPDTLTSIGGYAFYQCVFPSLVIPDSVTKIGDRAFYYCSALSDITLPNELDTISQYMLGYCTSLTSVDIPDSVATIQANAFYYSGLTSIELSDNVTSLGSSVFEGSNVASAKLPSGLTSIPSSLFARCPLKTVGLEGSSADLELPSGITSIGNIAFNQCKSLTSVEIPDGVESIGSQCFSSDSVLVSVKLPLNLTSIGSQAFSSCSALSSISIPDGVTSIGVNAFQSCTALSSISIPDGVDTISNYTFDGCSVLASVTLSKNLTTIGTYAFRNCKALTSIELPDGLTSIGGYAFYGCSALASVNIPDGVTSIGNQAFRDCTALTSIELPDTVTSLDTYAFYGCSKLSSVRLSSALTSIGNYTFQNCSSLAEINLPAGITSIGNQAFYGCSQLLSIELPAGVESIGSSAFYNCTSLASVTWPTCAVTIASKAFLNTALAGEIVLPFGSTYAEDSFDLEKVTVTISPESGDSNSGSFSDEKTFWEISDDGVLRIWGSGKVDDYYFDEDGENWNAEWATTVTSLVIEEGVTEIGDGAFGSLSSIAETVTMPASVSTIGKCLFCCCGDSPAFTRLVFAQGSALKVIPAQAFYGCDCLESVSLPDSLERIESDAEKPTFSCKALADIGDIPSTLVYIGDYAFYYTALEGVVVLPYSCEVGTKPFPDAVTVEWEQAPDENVIGAWEIGLMTPSALVATLYKDGTFVISGTGDAKSYTGITTSTRPDWWDERPDILSVEFGEGVSITNLNYWFYGCSNLVDVGELPSTVTSLGNTFYGCTSLAVAPTIPSGVTSLASTFSGCSSLVAAPTIPSGVTSLDSAFYRCSSLLQAPEIPRGVTNMQSTFYGCSSLVEAPLIPSTVTNMGTTFRECSSLKALPDGFTIPSGVTSLPMTFRNCSSLETLPEGFSIPSSVISMGQTFTGCTALVLPDGFTLPPYVTDIDWCFQNCSSIVSVPEGFTIPSTVTSLEQLFYGCSSLESLPESFTVSGNVTSMLGTFRECSSLKTVPEGLLGNASRLTNMTYAFYRCDDLTLPEGFTIPDGVTNMTYTFDSCYSLTLPEGFAIPESVTDMTRAFYNCEAIDTLPKSFTLPSGATKTDAFYVGRNYNVVRHLSTSCTENVYAAVADDAVWADSNRDLVPTDKTALNAAIEDALATDQSLATDEDWKALQEAIAAAEVVAADLDATQAEVDAMLGTLQEAVADFSNALASALKDVVGDLVDGASGLNGPDYTATTWAALEAALANAKAALADGNASPSELETVLAELESAIDGLAPAADKSGLEVDVAAAEALDESDYTPASWQKLAEALDAARTVLADGDATQAAVDDAAAALVGAVDDLQLLFHDVTNSNDWYYDAVYGMAGLGLITGYMDDYYGDGAEVLIFNHGGTMDRAQMATILWRMAGSPAPTGSHVFTDVDYSDFYGDAVDWAFEAGVVTGYYDADGNLIYDPSGGLDFEALVTMTARYALGSEQAAAAWPQNVLDDPRFADADKINDWARAHGLGDRQRAGHRLRRRGRPLLHRPRCPDGSRSRSHGAVARHREWYPDDAVRIPRSLLSALHGGGSAAAALPPRGIV